MQKEIIQEQVSLFFKENYTGDFDKISLELKKIIEGEGQTLILPLPKDAPDELPRLTLTYPELRINITPNRFDFVSATRQNTHLIQSIAESLENLGIVVGRVSLVEMNFVNGSIESLKKMLRDNLKEASLTEVSLRINVPTVINSRKCNNLESVDLGQIQNKQTEEIRSGILLTRDINTLHEDIKSASFTAHEIADLLIAFQEKAGSSFLID